MKKILTCFTASSLALLSDSVVAHVNKALMTEAEHQTMHVSDALMPVALMVVAFIMVRPLFKKMREQRIRR